MKKLLVVGDSFMHPDSNFVGQHWSEMLPEYEILMYSVSGSTNGRIAHQFYQGLLQQPDAVVLGFTEPNRLDFEFKGQWVSANYKEITHDQKLLADLYKIHVPHEMLMIKDCTMVVGMLSLLERRKIPYAWTLNLLFNNLYELPYPSDPWVKSILGEYFYRMTDTNLATYPNWKTSPGFHTDDVEWQRRYAQEARHITQLDKFLS